jgi:hypothetical protein
MAREPTTGTSQLDRRSQEGVPVFIEPGSAKRGVFPWPWGLRWGNEKRMAKVKKKAGRNEEPKRRTS